MEKRIDWSEKVGSHHASVLKQHRKKDYEPPQGR
jgi:hypothetical protein